MKMFTKNNYINILQKGIFLLMITSCFYSVSAETIPPAAISNLTAITGGSQGEVDLSWTAPGDDGMSGNLQAPPNGGYLVKYASFPVTGVNFYDSNISTFTQSWTPGATEYAESETVTGLTPAVTFYFAVKAYDDDGNYASWSTITVNTLNSAMAKNTAPAAFTLSSPADGVIESTNTPSFDWTDSSDTGDTFSYTIEYSSYSNFSVSISSVGISSSTYKPVTGFERQIEVANAYNLSNNFPNPFNPSTTIMFTIPENEFVTLEIFNPLGQKIETLLNKPMTAGQHEVKFNGLNFPSGIYFYRIEAGQFLQVKKMIRLK